MFTQIITWQQFPILTENVYNKVRLLYLTLQETAFPFVLCFVIISKFNKHALFFSTAWQHFAWVK